MNGQKHGGLHHGKYRSHMAASCAYHIPVIIVYLLNKLRTKKPTSTKSVREFSGREGGGGAGGGGGGGGGGGVRRVDH